MPKLNIDESPGARMPAHTTITTNLKQGYVTRVQSMHKIHTALMATLCQVSFASTTQQLRQQQQAGMLVFLCALPSILVNFLPCFKYPQIISSSRGLCLSCVQGHAKLCYCVNCGTELGRVGKLLPL